METKKQALLIGALGGLGSATTKLLSQSGWHVFAVDNKQEILGHFKQTKNITPVFMDVTKTETIKEAYQLLSAQTTCLDAVIEGPSKKIKLGDGNELLCKALLVSSGVSYRKLEAIGISDLTGAGIYYGAARSEGGSVKDQDIFIIGGANSAGQAAMYFSKFARTVTMLIRGESISSSMSQYLIDQIGDIKNISVRTKTQVKEAIGSSRLKSLVLSLNGGQSEETVSAGALFVFIGAVPNTEWLGDRIARDSHRFVLSGPDIRSNGQKNSAPTQDRNPYMLETSLPGVFVAGDVRHGSIKRVASAVGEGSMAVMFVHQYLNTV